MGFTVRVAASRRCRLVRAVVQASSTTTQRELRFRRRRRLSFVLFVKPRDVFCSKQPVASDDPVAWYVCHAAELCKKTIARIEVLFGDSIWDPRRIVLDGKKENVDDA